MDPLSVPIHREDLQRSANVTRDINQPRVDCLISARISDET